MMLYKDINFNDGSIKKIISTPGVLEVIFEDWKEIVWNISFNDLIAFESLGAEGEELGDFFIEESNEYKDKVLKLLPDEAKSSSKVYVFKSAWSGVSVLKVLGGELKVTQFNKWEE